EHEDDVLAREQPAQQAVLGGLRERLIRGDLVLELLIMRVERCISLRLSRSRVAEPAREIWLECGGSDHYADRQGQEHGQDGYEAVAEANEWKSPLSQCQNGLSSSPINRNMTGPTGSAARATTIVTAAATTSRTSQEVEIRLRYSRLTPLGSTILSLSRILVRNALAIPGRPLSRNSTSVVRMPTATISRAPSSSVSSSATSSLVPFAGQSTESSPSSRTRSRPGAAPSAYAWTTISAPHVSARSETESMSPTIMCGRYPASRSASAPPSTATRTGLNSLM